MNTLYSIFRNHPRIRGTNGYLSIGPFFLMGSSPHTRDKFSSNCVCSLLYGIIPAYAGQIRHITLDIFGSEDHPRIRGTNTTRIPVSISRPGSSPHTRDKFGSLYGGVINGRIIPAYAGQIPRICRISESLRDHPRIRGTNARLYLATAIGSGSSPHTRDKLSGLASTGANQRIIPAYAGQIGVLRSITRGRTDHPRIRGTN